MHFGGLGHGKRLWQEWFSAACKQGAPPEVTRCGCVGELVLPPRKQFLAAAPTSVGPEEGKGQIPWAVGYGRR